MLLQTLTLMSQFGLPDPNGNVLDEQIEWDSIIESETPVMLIAFWKKGPIWHYINVITIRNVTEIM